MINATANDSFKRWTSRPHWYSWHQDDTAPFYDFVHTAYLDGLTRDDVLGLMKEHIATKHRDWLEKYTDHILHQFISEVEVIYAFLKHINYPIGR
jgi:hypothetical protein